jgi:hypothetical protein
MEISQIIDRYQQKKEAREKDILQFLNGSNQPEDRKFMVIQRPTTDMFGACNTLEQVYSNNIANFEKSLLFEWTDELPYLEPWIGVGVYATAFGGIYKWREDNAPDTYYAYHKIDEVKNVEYPDYRKSPIMGMVLDCIDYMKEKTLGKLPISCTDTQSPFDTATLILDAAEFFTACYTQEEIVFDFMKKVTDLIIEFSNVQGQRIGKELWIRPGHIMVSSTTYRGLSISDDNLPVSSPKINQKIAFPFDQMLADAFDGLAIHSCGNWAKTMSRLDQMKNIIMIDCAVSKVCDPTPNVPHEVRDAMKGKGIITKVRMGNDLAEILPQLEDLVDPDLKLVIELTYDEAMAEKNYKAVTEKLEELYQ